VNSGVSTSRYTRGTGRAILVTNPVINHQRGKDRSLITTDGTYQWQGNKYTFISLDDMTVFHEHRYFVRIRPFKKEFVFPCRTLKDISDCNGVNTKIKMYVLNSIAAFAY
jgi:hypothetical protein